MDPSPPPLTSCPHCAVQVPQTATFCPGCGHSMSAEPISAETTSEETTSGETTFDEATSGDSLPVEPRAHGTVGALPENIVGGLAYFTFLPAIVFLLLDPYHKNRFVRFHSLQCLLLWAAAVLFAIALKLASVVLLIIPMLGPLLVWIVGIVVSLAALVIWLVLVIKAFQGEMFKLPVLGDLASQPARE
jgi:uncharacterized membrane protein